MYATLKDTYYHGDLILKESAQVTITYAGNDGLCTICYGEGGVQLTIGGIHVNLLQIPIDGEEPIRITEAEWDFLTDQKNLVFRNVDIEDSKFSILVSDLLERELPDNQSRLSEIIEMLEGNGIELATFTLFNDYNCTPDW